ncbi:MAG: esterase family protein [Streptococcaceae bacterium]|jgi:putative tributyrin esterase|nr:esterase family protein [Streptococcaceae bacterium]
MAILDIEYYSEVLEIVRPLKVIYPEPSKIENYKGVDIPVLYLLHGMSGNQNSWLVRTGIDRLVRQTELAVVMPATDDAWYTNTTYGQRYFDAVALELPQVLHNFFPNLSTKREKNFVAGLSMGGYGAFKLALGTAHFSYAASLSGALYFTNDLFKEHAAARPDYWRGIFGDLDHFEENPNQLLNIAKMQSGEKPKLYAWCGLEDDLCAGNDFIARELPKFGYDLTYETAHGRHEWYYWAKQLERVFAWLPIDWKKEERLS